MVCVMVSNDKRRVMISVSENTLQKLDALRSNYDLTLSQMIQFMIMDYLERKEK